MTLLIFVYTKEGWLVGQIRAGEGCMRVEGIVWNTLKGRETEKRGGETDFIKEGKQGQGVGALKKGGGWNLLTNYKQLEMGLPQIGKVEFYWSVFK